MKKTIAATVAVIALGAAIPLAATAGSGWHDDRGGKHHGMKSGHGEMRGHRGERHGMHRGGGVRARIAMQEMIATYDIDGDGRVTQDEVDQWRAQRLASFDADGDGQLSLDEYERLWLDVMRERMVDQFQEHDDDGDGQVTVDEFGERTENIVTMRDRNEDGAISLDDLRRGRVEGRRGDRSAADGEAEEGATGGTAPTAPGSETPVQQ